MRSTSGPGLRLATASAIVLSLSSLAPSPALRAQDGLAADPPSAWASRELLEALPAALHDARGAVVSDTLARVPAAAETLLLALISEGWQEAAWTGSTSPALPADPSRVGTHVPGRGLSLRTLSPEGLENLSVSVRGGGDFYSPMGLEFVSPLILDTSRDGKPGVPGGRWEPHAGFDFTTVLVADINGDGFREITEWVDGSDALLVDPSRPGSVVDGPNGPRWQGPISGRDLLGTAEGYRSGFEKLALRDGDSDGSIRGSELAGLLLWRDIDADAEVDAGELSTLAAAGIDLLTLPPEGTSVGAFGGSRGEGRMWDWWPSYALARREARGGVPVALPDAVNLVPYPRLHFPPADEAAAGGGASPVGFGADNASLEAAGLDRESAKLVALSPEGSRVLLAGDVTEASEIAGGSGVELLALDLASGDLPLRAIPLPLAALVQAVFLDERHVLASGDGGSRLLGVDLASGEVVTLYERRAGEPGFRFGNRFWRTGGIVYSTGYFHDGEGRMRQEVIARYSSEGEIAAVTPIASLQRPAEEIGPIREELLVSPELAWFVVKGAKGSTLVAVRSGVASAVDAPVSLAGIAASGTRCLYFHGSGPESEVRVHNLASGRTITLGRGEHTYPYLAAGGGVAVVSRIDWESGFMDIDFGLLAGGESPLFPLATAASLAAIRVAEDGQSLAWLDADGLQGTTIGLPSDLFLRADGNGDGKVDISDGIFILAHLFLGGPAPGCRAAADATADGSMDISDAIWIFSHLFLGGPPPPPPYPDCGPDPSGTGLDCVRAPAC